jgi:hypothetical protein
MKTVIFVVLALATLGAVGVTTTFMSSATVAHAAGCHGGSGAFVCPPSQESQSGFVCNQGVGCRDIGRPQ